MSPQKRYNSRMRFMKAAGRFILSSVFSMTLLSFGLLFALWMVFSTPGNLKGALAESGIYTSLPTQILKNEQAQNGQISAIPVNRPEIKAIFKDAFTTTKLEKSANTVIDSTYDWLQGNTAHLQFRIDFSQEKAHVISNVGAYVEKRLQGLPQCPAGQISPLVDVFTVSCLPPGLSISTAVTQVEKDLANADSPLKEPVITPDTFVGSDGKSLEENLASAPQTYQGLQQALYVLAALAILTGLGTFFAFRPWRQGLRRVAFILVSAGATSVFIASLGIYALQKVITQATNSLPSDDVLTPYTGKLATLLSSEIRNWWLGYSIVILLLGGALFLWYWWQHPKQQQLAPELHDQSKKTAQIATPPSPTEETPQKDQ